LGLGDLIAAHLGDTRSGKNTQFPLADLFRQSVYSRMAGYEDVNDAERLSQDPAFRLIGSEKVWDRGVALTSRLQTFETEMLAEDENFGSLYRINCALVGKAEAIDAQQRIVLDMDSTEIPVYGQQENSAYNGHFESTCYRGDRQPGGGAVLQQAWHRRAVDQGGQAGGENDPAELPSVPVQRGSVVAERDGVQLGEPVAAAGAAAEDRRLVAEEFAAAVGENGWPVDQARPLLLAAAGGKSPNAAAVRGDGVKDRRLTG
jgi:hypothetical protein